jgi:putative Ca2+/H+ antiporter (TMEM165/GDT1 family)
MVIIGARYCISVESGMEWKLLLTVFGAVFIAELGDKTQLATLLFAAEHEVSKWTVFIAASLALIATSAIGVLAGGAIAQFMSPKTLSLIAGAGFIIIGVFTLIRA